eukprot:UN33472
MDPLVLFIVLPNLREKVGSWSLFPFYYTIKILELGAVIVITLIYCENDHMTWNDINLDVLKVASLFSSMFFGLVVTYLFWGFYDKNVSLRRFYHRRESSINVISPSNIEETPKVHALSWSGKKVLWLAGLIAFVALLMVTGLAILLLLCLTLLLAFSPFIILFWMCNQREGVFSFVLQKCLKWAYSWLFWVHMLALVMINQFEDSPKYVVDVSGFKTWDEFMKKNISKSGKRRLNKYVKKAFEKHKIEKVHVGYEWRVTLAHWRVFWSHMFR